MSGERFEPGPAGPRTGYQLVLPPGWARIPLNADAGKAVDAILDPKFVGLPMDTYGPHKARLRATLMAQVDAARKNQGIDLYLPVEQVHGATLACSFVVAHMPFSTVEKPDADDVLVAFAAETDDARFVEIDGAPAVRSEQVVEGRPNAGEEQQYPSRRVDYVMSIPKQVDQWLSVSFSAIADGDPAGDIALLLVELFDAVMTTFEWVYEDEQSDVIAAGV